MSAIIFVKLYINFNGYMSWSLVLNYLLTYLLVGSPYNTHIIPQYTIPKTKQIYKVVLWIKNYIYNCLAWFSNLQLLYLTIPQPPRIPNRSITCAMQSVRNRNFASYSNRVICLGKLWNLSTYGGIKYTMSIFLGCHKTRAYFLKKISRWIWERVKVQTHSIFFSIQVHQIKDLLSQKQCCLCFVAFKKNY